MGKLIRGLFVVSFLIEFSSYFFVSSFTAETDVLFFLRIRNRGFDESEEITFSTKEEISNAAFDPKKPIIFQVHGYLEDRHMPHHSQLSE